MQPAISDPTNTVGEFVNRLYVPQNTFVAVIADSKEIDETKKMVEKAFANLKSKESPVFEDISKIKAFKANEIS